MTQETGVPESYQGWTVDCAVQPGAPTLRRRGRARLGLPANFLYLPQDRQRALLAARSQV